MEEKQISNDVTKAEKLKWYGKVGQWFQTFCWMNIPIFGFFYMLVKAISKKTPEDKKAFATAYVLYRILVMVLAITVLIVLYRMGLGFVDGILQYVKE